MNEASRLEGEISHRRIQCLPWDRGGPYPVLRMQVHAEIRMHGRIACRGRNSGNRRGLLGVRHNEAFGHCHRWHTMRWGEHCSLWWVLILRYRLRRRWLWLLNLALRLLFNVIKLSRSDITVDKSVFGEWIRKGAEGIHYLANNGHSLPAEEAPSRQSSKHIQRFIEKLLCVIKLEPILWVQKASC